MNEARRFQLVAEKEGKRTSGSARRRAYWWALKAFLLVTFCTGVALWGSFKLVSLYTAAEQWARDVQHRLMNKVTRVEVRRELVNSSSVPLAQLTVMVSKKHKVPEVVLRAVVDQESSNGEYLYRFEPNKFAQLKARMRLPDSELRMLASSHGVGHVMGFNAEPRCGVHWSRLYDPATGLECAAKLLRENMDRHSSVKSMSRRIWLALRDYNGSGKDAEAYATTVMAKVGSLMLAELKDNA